MKTSTIETSRLQLRPLNINDAEHIYISWGCDDDVSKYMRWNTHQSINDTREWLLIEEKNIDSDENYTWGFVLKSTGKLIGSGGLSFNKDKYYFELGYGLMKDAWGNGYATEAATRIIEFAKNELGLQKLFCCHASENYKSQRIIEKLGFVYNADGHYNKFDGRRKESKEYYLQIV